MGIPIISMFLVIWVSIVIIPTLGQEVLNTGITLSLNGILYYLPGKPFSSGHASIYTTCASRSKTSSIGLVPITVVNSSSATVNLGALESVIDAFSQQDDVWGESFLSGIHPTFGAPCPALRCSKATSANI